MCGMPHDYAPHEELQAPCTRNITVTLNRPQTAVRFNKSARRLLQVAKKSSATPIGMDLRCVISNNGFVLLRTPIKSIKKRNEDLKKVRPTFQNHFVSDQFGMSFDTDF